MKHVYKFLVLILIMVMADQSHGQSLSLRGGLSFANMDFDHPHIDLDLDWKPGFHIGIFRESQLISLLSIETGLMIVSKGHKASDTETMGGYEIDYETTTNLLYLDVPITAKAVIGIGNMNVYGVLGPYAGVGLAGKYKYKVTQTINGDTHTESGEEDIEWGSDDTDDFKRLDFGLLAGAGIELNALTIGLSYGMGLANINPHEFDINHKVINISIGYKINR